MSKMDRKDFLAALAAGAGLAALGGCGGQKSGDGSGALEDEAALGMSRIVRCRRLKSITAADVVNETLVRKMVDWTVTSLMKAATAEQAWKMLFAPSDVVVVKVNSLFGPGACTHPAVAWAVVSGIMSAGVAAGNITLYDRGENKLRAAGYTLNSGPGVKVVASQWATETITHRSINGQLATVLLRPENTALVNIPCLKHHARPGITCALKNHFGSFWPPHEHHDNECDPALADLNDIPVIRDKTRLIVVDALRPVGHRGPQAAPEYTFTYGGILAGRDPVAIDSVGVRILDEWRTAQGLARIAPEAHYLDSAVALGLGNREATKIRLVNV